MNGESKNEGLSSGKEELLLQVLDASEQMVQVSDVNTFELLYANQPTCEFSGKGRDPLKGETCYQYMMGMDEPCPFCPFLTQGDKASAMAEIDNGEQIFQAKTTLISWHGRPAFVEYAWDVTASRRYQKIYESQVKNLIASIPNAQGVFHVDLDADEVLSINGISALTDGMSSDKGVDALIGEIAAFAPNGDERKEFLETFSSEALRREHGKGQAEVQMELESQFDDGSVREALITARLLMNPTTNHLEGIIYGTDISEEKRKEREQRRALEEALALAEHANRAKTTFLNNISHDIRTPMNAIIGFTALAAAHLDDRKTVQDYLKKISTSGNHLLSLINDVLDMSRIESGLVKIDQNDVHLPDVLHDLRTIIQGSISAKQQDLYIDTQDVVHEDIVTDRLRLNQILLNLISNATKFTPIGGTITIRVSERRSPREGHAVFEFRVKDNGIGMSKEFQRFVFDSFERERSSTVSGIQGTGLGMAITKNIIDMMGGTISINSEEGKGSEFIVKLDCKLVEGANVKAGPIPELEGSRALVVDDDMNTCMGVSKMLRQIGMRPDWTTSGRESVMRAKEACEQADEFKVFIIDWLMPDMSGIAVVRNIRAVIGDSTPIIILTAYDWSDIEAEAREAGVTAFVSKPLFMSELREVLSSRETVEPESELVKTSLAGKKILVVEDNELNQEIAVALLEEAGFVTDVANDGTVAVERMANAASDEYDLILMDVQMPRMDGYTAAREIRTLDDNRKANIPIIAMTANAFEEDRRKAFESGMNGHLSKPIVIDTLVSAIEKASR